MNRHDLVKPVTPTRPTEQQAHEAIRTLIGWAGDNPAREGLQDTPARVARAYKEWFAGYDTDPDALLQRTFEEVEGYNEMVLLKAIRFESYCEHHLAPIIGLGACRLCPHRPSRRNIQTRPRSGCFRQTPASPRKNDRPDCKYH